MQAPHPLHERMVDAARDLEEQHDSQLTYESAVRLATANVTGADAAALMIVRRRSRVETLAVTAGWAGTADQLQYELGEGPCLDATWDHHLVHSRDLAIDQRWPTWGPRAAESTGVRSILSLQLFTQAGTLGALNLYSRRTEAFDDDARTDGLTTATHIALAIASAHEVEDLESAVASRTVISSAVGITMERYGITEQRAFAVMSRIASERETKIRFVAAEVLAEHRQRHGLA